MARFVKDKNTEEPTTIFPISIKANLNHLLLIYCIEDLLKHCLGRRFLKVDLPYLSKFNKFSFVSQLVLNLALCHTAGFLISF